MLQDTPEFIAPIARERQAEVREITQTLHRSPRAGRPTGPRRWWRPPERWATAFRGGRATSSTATARVRRRRNRVPHPV